MGMDLRGSQKTRESLGLKNTVVAVPLVWTLAKRIRRRLAAGVANACALVPLLLALAPQQAQALPAFARQTGQNCVACHAGGQFPELTPYGRLFKMTGYTIGERALPLSVMGVFSDSKSRTQ